MRDTPLRPGNEFSCYFPVHLRLGFAVNGVSIRANTVRVGRDKGISVKKGVQKKWRECSNQITEAGF